MFRVQQRIKGLTRVAQWSCFHPRIEAQVQADMARWKASRSFVIAEIVAMHYDEMRKPRTAIAREVTEAMEHRIISPEPEEPRAADAPRGRVSESVLHRARRLITRRAASPGRETRAHA